MRSFGLYINGQYVQSGRMLPAISPAEDGEPFAAVAFAETGSGEELIEAALQGTHETFKQIERGFFPLHERLTFLERLKSKLTDNLDFCAKLISTEVGKPIRLARTEVTRSIATIEWTCLEAPRLFANAGLPTQSRETSAAFEGWTLRNPRGPLLAITPFNFPLNLVMHKVAPALACGCPVILKPSPKSAVTALALADLCHASGLPAGMLSVINADNGLTRKLINDDRIAQISFTGSAKVGWELARGTAKPVFLELGGTAPVFVDESADLEAAASAIVTGGMSYAGQVCISVQNAYAHRAVAADLKKLLIAKISKLEWGSPASESTLAGGVIDRAAAERLEKLRAQALNAGAKILAEAPLPTELAPEIMKKAGTFVRPTLFEGAPPDNPIVSEEVFGPFINFATLDNFDKFIELVNGNRYRFQTAVFTRDLATAFRAARELRFGAVMINQDTSYRFEPMAFGGHGLSGTGTEGPRYAMESFTELKSVMMKV